MSKRNFLILGIAIVVVIAAVWYYNSVISGGVVRAPGSQCIDSDYGLNYYEKGKVLYMKETFEDKCEGGALSEQYCKQSIDDKKWYPATDSYTCLDGCEDAACIYGEKEKTMPI